MTLVYATPVRAAEDAAVAVTVRDESMTFSTQVYPNRDAANDAILQMREDGIEARISVAVEPYDLVPEGLVSEGLAQAASGADPLASQQWAIEAMGATGLVEEGHDGAGVIVGVVDTGIADHADLQGVVIGRHDFARGKSDRRHGTAVAGIIAGKAGNAEGGRGIAPGVKILDAEVCGRVGCEEADVANGIVWAVSQGADVVNLSLGTPFFSAAMNEAVQWALQHNVTVVVANGNTACRARLNNGGNANCLRQSRSMNSLARIPGVIAVAAIGEDGTRAEYSSYGIATTLGAPTDVVAPDQYQYSLFAGTSAAAPHASAAAALVLQAQPDLTGREVAAVLQASTKPYIRALTAETWESCGAYNPSDSSWDGCVGLATDGVSQRELGGSGHLDVRRALDLVNGASAWSEAPEVVVADPVADADGVLQYGIEVTPRAVSGADLYIIFADGVEQGRSTGGPVHVSANDAARVAIQVRAMAEGVEKAESRIILADTRRSVSGVPVVLSANNTRVVVSSASLVSGAVGMLVEDMSGNIQAGCAGYPNEATYWCGWDPQPGAWYRARYQTADGLYGGASTPFQAIETRSSTRVEASATAYDGVVEVRVRPHGEGVEWNIGATGGTYTVDKNGYVTLQSEGSTTCAKIDLDIVCRTSAENGRTYRPWVYAVDENGIQASRVENLWGVTPEPVIGVGSDIRVEYADGDKVRIRFDGGVSWRADGMHIHNVHTSFGVALGANADEKGWYADVLLYDGYAERASVTVMAGEWIHTSVGGWWLAEGAPVTAVLDIPGMRGPTVSGCTSEETAIHCQMAASADETAGSWYEWRIRDAGTGSTVYSSTTGRVAEAFGYAGLVAGHAYMVEARCYQTRTNGRRSAWTSQVVQTKSAAVIVPVKAPSVPGGEPAVELPGGAPSKDSPAPGVDTGALPTESLIVQPPSAPVDVPVQVQVPVATVNGSYVVVRTAWTKSMRIMKVYENGRYLGASTSGVVRVKRMTNGVHRLVVKTWMKNGRTSSASVRIVVGTTRKK